MPKFSATSMRVLKNTTGPLRTIPTGAKSDGHFVLGRGTQLNIQNRAVKNGELEIGIGSYTRVAVDVAAGDSPGKTAKALASHFKAIGFKQVEVKAWPSIAKIQLFKIP